jgi:hypothetical protein
VVQQRALHYEHHSAVEIAVFSLAIHNTAPSTVPGQAHSYHSPCSLKFGLYTARGSSTCQLRPGSLDHELIDAATYCAWGIDYIKIDRCRGAAKDGRTSWTRFHQGLFQCYNNTGKVICVSTNNCMLKSTRLLQDSGSGS